MKYGQHVSILIGSATCPTAVAVRMLHAQVTSETEKAVQLTVTNREKRIEGRTLWFPKKALVEKGTSFRIAPWFKVSSFMDWVFDQVEVAAVGL